MCSSTPSVRTPSSRPGAATRAPASAFTARWRTRREELAVAVIACQAAVRLAQRVHVLLHQVRTNTEQTTELIAHSPARDLLDQPGIGPVTDAGPSRPARNSEVSAQKPRSPASPAPIRYRPHPATHLPPQYQPGRRPPARPSPHGHRHLRAHGPDIHT